MLVNFFLNLLVINPVIIISAIGCKKFSNWAKNKIESVSLLFRILGNEPINKKIINKNKIFIM